MAHAGRIDKKIIVLATHIFASMKYVFKGEASFMSLKLVTSYTKIDHHLLIT